LNKNIELTFVEHCIQTVGKILHFRKNKKKTRKIQEKYKKNETNALNANHLKQLVNAKDQHKDFQIKLCQN